MDTESPLLLRPIQHSRVFGGCSTVIMRTRCCYQLCLAADRGAAETMSAFTHSPWHQTHGHSIFAVFLAQWNEESRLGGMEGGKKCKRKWREKQEGARWRGGWGRPGSCVKHGGYRTSSRDWWLLHVTEMTHTFSTSALVTLMSASIFSKYCCALSASLQSLSNLLLHWKKERKTNLI